MSFVATAIVGSAAIGAGASIYAANKASNAQTEAGNKAIAAQQQMYNQGVGEAKGAVQPFIDFGAGNLPTLKNLLTPGANMNDTLAQMPGFQFANEWGQKGITNQATANGKGGNALQAGAKYATGLAQNTYGTIVDNLLKSAGIGQGAAQSFAGSVLPAATGVGQGIAGSLTGIGNAQGGAAIAEGNAVGGLGNSVSNAFTLNALTGGKLLSGSTGMYGNAGVKGVG